MDEICIRKVLEGDIEEFRFLITKYKDMAFSISMSVLKDEFLAEEITQISFVKAYEKLSSFKGISKFSTWFYRIVINEYFFKALRNKKKEILDFVELTSETIDGIENTIGVLEENDQRFFINEALKILNPRESLVLRLFYLHENSVEEVKNITG